MTQAITGGGFETAVRDAHVERSIRPTEGRALVVPFTESAVTPGGIIKPDTAREKERRGKVVALGPGWRTAKGTLVPFEFGPGDVVLFNGYAGKYAGTELVLPDGTKALMVWHEDIIGIEEQS